MTLVYPLVALAGLAAAVAFLAFVRVAEQRTRHAALAYSQLQFLEALTSRVPWTALIAGAWSFALLAGGLALAHPRIVANVAVHDASVVLCIDTSGSMSSTDVTPTRAEAARNAAAAFIAGVPVGTRIGLVAFNSSALPLGTLTDDPASARDDLARLPAPNGDTAIGDALSTAAQLLPHAGRRAIVVVTDGVNNAGRDPLEVAQTLGASGIGIFTVGIGTNGSGELIPGTTEAAELDEDALRSVARAGGGTYASAADAAALRDRLATLAARSVMEQRHLDLALPFAGGAAFLALAAVVTSVALGRFP